MKRFFALLAAVLLLTACAAEPTDTRVEDIQRRYAEMSGCTARLDVTVARADTNEVYTLDVERNDGGTRVTVVDPEALAGVTARVENDGALQLQFDGMLLDAGSAGRDVSALNAADILLNAAAGGYVKEQSGERYDGVSDALRVCFETAVNGETLLVTAYFDAEDAPLYAEIERDGEILAYLEFTDFAFGDILPTS